MTWCALWVKDTAELNIDGVVLESPPAKPWWCVTSTHIYHQSDDCNVFVIKSLRSVTFKNNGLSLKIENMLPFILTIGPLALSLYRKEQLLRILLNILVDMFKKNQHQRQIQFLKKSQLMFITNVMSLKYLNTDSSWIQSEADESFQHF